MMRICQRDEDVQVSLMTSRCQKPGAEEMQGGLLPGPAVCTQPDKPLKAGVLNQVFSQCNTAIVVSYQARQDC